MTRPSRVVLVGGGVGGLTAAIALARRGVACVVLEQAEAFREIGAGLQLAPNATRALAALGMADDLAAVGFAPLAAEVRDSAGGGLLLRTDLGEAAVARWGAPYLQLHRADLQAMLLRHALALGVEVRTGARVEAVEQDATAARVQSACGTAEGDAVVGCDGVHSRLRDALFGPTPARFAGQVAWRALVPADRLAPGAVPPTAAVWTGRGRHLVHYFVRGGALVNLVGVVDGQAWTQESWSEPGDPRTLATAFAGWPEPVADLLAAVDTCWRWAIHDRAPLPRWSVGRIALLGDAAHPTAPFLAQGAGMAIEDACALAHHLCVGAPVPEALTAYAKARHARTARVRAWGATQWRAVPPAVVPAPRGLFRGATDISGPRCVRRSGLALWRRETQQVRCVATK